MGFRLNPMVPIIFQTGSSPWKTHRVLADLIGGPEELRAFAPRWEPLFWDLAERDPQTLLASAGKWRAALAVLRAEGEKDAAAFHAVGAAAAGGAGAVAVALIPDTIKAPVSAPR